jgi:hypothetical protein
MKKNEEYLKEFKRLVEYKISDTHNNSSNFLPPLVEEEEEVIVEPIVSVDNTTDEFEDVEAIKQGLSDDELNKLAQEDDLTRVKNIQDQQTEEINKLIEYVDEITKNINDLKQKTIDIENMKKNIDIVNKKIKAVTPVTPEEQLEKMATISGGMSIKDVWNNYLLDTSIKQAIENKEEETKQYSEPIEQIKNFNDSEIKQSFYK